MEQEFVTVPQLARRARTYWWLPACLGIAGVLAGVLLSGRIAPLHRAEASLLVGPVAGTMTLSTTLRASESQAGFYADLVRREAVLEPVGAEVGEDWRALLPGISAVVPDQNPRVIVLTVTDRDAQRARQVAEAIIATLDALDPDPPAESASDFTAAQLSRLQGEIDTLQARADQLSTQLRGAKGAEATRLRAELGTVEDRLSRARGTYVGLLDVQPEPAAGGLSVLDEVHESTAMDRPGVMRQSAVLGVVGVVTGLCLAWAWARVRGWRRRSRRGRRAEEPADDESPASTTAQRGELADTQV